MAASSSVSKMMIKWAKMNGVETLNIVHKEEHVVDLKNNYGANFFSTASLQLSGMKLRKQ